MNGLRFPKVRPCRHTSTISVTTSGLERRVCEACGTVTVRYEFSISGDAKRENFARPSEARALPELGNSADQDSDQDFDRDSVQDSGRHTASSGAVEDWPFLEE